MPYVRQPSLYSVIQEQVEYLLLHGSGKECPPQCQECARLKLFQHAQQALLAPIFEPRRTFLDTSREISAWLAAFIGGCEKANT